MQAVPRALGSSESHDKITGGDLGPLFSQVQLLQALGGNFLSVPVSLEPNQDNQGRDRQFLGSQNASSHYLLKGVALLYG